VEQYKAIADANQKKFDALSGTKDEIIVALTLGQNMKSFNANPLIKELKSNYLNDKKFAELVEEHKKALTSSSKMLTMAASIVEKSINSVTAIKNTAKDRIDQQRKITEIMKEIMETIN